MKHTWKTEACTGSGTREKLKLAGLLIRDCYVQLGRQQDSTIHAACAL